MVQLLVEHMASESESLAKVFRNIIFKIQWGFAHFTRLYRDSCGRIIVNPRINAKADSFLFTELVGSD